MNSTARRAEKKRRPAILFTLAGLLAFGMSGSLQAQLSADEKTQNTKRTSEEKKSSDAAEGEVITLSPFVVTSETERGYQATSTLAGTRIRTPLEDIGTAISVLTSEFLKDTGSNKAVDALVFATGTEVNGLGGNFATYSTTTGSNNKVMVPTTSSSPDTRVRGLASADLTRGYFRTSIPFDSFSIDRIEVNRGSNAVLFGVGSPAGIINYAPKLAQLNRNSGVLQVSADNYGSLRESLDANQVIVRDQFSVRVALLNDEQKYRQEEAFNDSKRLFAATTISPKALQKGIFAGTTLRANVEVGEINANNPQNTPPINTYSSWVAPTPSEIAAGAVRQKTHDATIAFALGNSGGISVAGPSTLTRSPIFMFENPASGIALDSASGGVGRQWAGSLLGRDLNGNLATAAMLASYYLPPAPANALGLWYAPSVTDRSTFDYLNHILTGKNAGQENKFNVYTVTLEQLFFKKKVGLELAYDSQEMTSRAFSIGTPWGASIITVDANTKMIDGSINPNFGRPFISVSPEHSYGENTISTARATAFGEFDFREHISGMGGQLLGRHVVTLLAQEEKTRNENRWGYMFYLPDTYAYGLNQNRYDNFGKQVQGVIYLGPSLYGASSAANANLQPISGDIIGGMARASAGNFVVRQQAANAPFSQQSFKILQDDSELNENAGSATLSRRVIDSAAANLQSYWLGNHVITTFGLRKEKVSLASVNAPSSTDGQNYRLVGSDSYTLESVTPQVVKDTLTAASAVVKVPEKWLKWQGIVSGAILTAAKSENFAPPVGTRYDSQGNLLPPPQGSTKDIGFTLKLLNGRIILKSGYYQTTQSEVNNSALTPYTTQILTLHRLVYNSITSGFSPDAGNHFPAGYVAPPQALLDLYKVAVNNGVMTFTNPGVVATSDFKATGWEEELTINLTKNWTTVVNVARQESVRSNTGASLGQLLYNTPLANGKNLFDTWTTSGNMFPIFSQAQSPGATQGFLSDSAKSVYSAFNSNVYQDGGPAPELRRWRANLTTRYDLRDWINGLWVGGSVRWLGRVATGFPAINYNGSVISDSKNPYWGPETTAIDLACGYEWPILKNRYRMTMQVNARNVFGNNELIPVRANPDGSIAVYRLPEPMRISVSTGLKF